MRYGIVSLEGVSLWAAARLQDEGHEVLLYHAPPPNKPFVTPDHRHIGEGIVPIATTWEQFVTWQPDVFYFESSGWGTRADMLRKSGKSVFGSCAYYDKLEHDRSYGIELARHCGISVPEYYEFSRLSESIAWIAKRPSDERWYFKADRYLGAAFTASGDKAKLSGTLKWIQQTKGDRIAHLLQKEVKGADLMTAAYWNGTSFLYPFMGTLERKEFGSGDTGPKTGASVSLAWHYAETPKIAHDEGWKTLASVLRQHETPPCIIDINTVVSFEDSKPYFLEWTPRLGYDSEPTASLALQMEYGEFIARLCESTLAFAPFSTDEAALGVRVTVPPYPFEYEEGTLDLKHSPFDLPLLNLTGDSSLWGARKSDPFVAYGVKGSFACADPGGLLGIVATTGTDLEAMNDHCVNAARKLDVADLGFRTDGAAALKKDLAKVARAGHWTPDL